MSDGMSIKDNIENIRRRLGPKVTLVAVIKNVPLDKVFAALEAGVTDLGESRVQEAAERFRVIKEKFPHVRYHLVGHLQRNKVGQALDIFDIIQSVDSERLARAISAKAKAGKTPVLIEVNTSGEPGKYGAAAEAAVEFVKKLAGFNNLEINGLMTIAPPAADPQTVRPCFAKLKKISDEITALDLPNVKMRFLSMGMSADYEIAVEEGANLVRIGRAIFGGG